MLVDIFTQQYLNYGNKVMTSTKNLTYKDAGVDIQAGNSLVDKIKDSIKCTTRAGVYSEVGGFGGVFDLAKLNYKDPLLVSSTDGVGTKLKIALETQKHTTIGIDLVAMCVNDIVVQGAEPIFFLDYFATSKLDIEIANEVISGIAEGCRISKCALIGGETAEMPGLYHNQDYDLAGFAVGLVERGNLLPKKQEIVDGDIIIGVESSGIHANGYSLIRYLLTENRIDISDPAPFSPGHSIAEALLKPTHIYVDMCLELTKEKAVKAFAHITGGGITENIPRIMPDQHVAKIDTEAWRQPPIFNWVQKLGNITQEEMLKTFNCGIGMAIIVDANMQHKALQMIRKHFSEAYVIGHVIKSLEHRDARVKYI